jgi:hypothetical protein
MRTRHGLSFASLGLTALALAALSCNLPRSFVVSFFPSLDSDEINEKAATLVADLPATMVNEDMQVQGLELFEGARWTCRDVDGVVSELVRSHTGIDTDIVRKAELDLTMTYRDDKTGLNIWYKDDFAMDSAVVNGVTGEIVAWNSHTWSGTGQLSGSRVNSRGTFSGSMTVMETRQGTYPKTVTSQVEEIHNLFGLIPSEDYRRAYLCDLRANTIPDDLAGLTAENFQQRCIFDYYECDAY